ncbi:MAG: aspartyl/asparaginyl beta-hydroxylase domain-containing protein [Pseudomonadota bacterium]
MEDTQLAQNRLSTMALNAETHGDLEKAAMLYRQAIDLDPANPLPYLFFGHALLLGGNETAATEVWSLGSDIDPRLTQTWRSEAAAPEVRQRSHAADITLRRVLTQQHHDFIESQRAVSSADSLDVIADAIWCQTHDTAFEYRDPEQRPHLMLVPSLQPIPVYSKDQLPWLTKLEAAASLIRDEYLAAREAAQDQQAPYVEAHMAALGDEWQPLANSMNWGSLHLYKRGKENPALTALFPETLQILEQLPLVRTPTGPSEVLFSVLEAGQRIPPHYGVSNTDVTVHLPIVTVDDAAIKVREESFPWQDGTAFAFDDAYLHESWNHSDEPRVNLLFEAWHPDLNAEEQAALTAAIATRANWNAARSLDHGLTDT